MHYLQSLLPYLSSHIVSKQHESYAQTDMVFIYLLIAKDGGKVIIAISFYFTEGPRR